MKKPATYTLIKICSILVALVLIGCDPIEDVPNNTNPNQISTVYGTVQLSFPIDDHNVPHRCIKRADLSVAYTADSLYRNEYVTVANVSNYQSLYEFNLEPGKYYYKAGKTCICGGDTCLWGGYPGGQNGMIWKMAPFDINSGEITYDHITFE